MVALRESVLLEVNTVPATYGARLSIHVLLGEAIRLAAFVDRTWLASDQHPGLQSAALHLGPDIANDLLGLTVAIQSCLAAATPEVESRQLRAEQLHDELAAVLRFLFNEGRPPERFASEQRLSTSLRARLVGLAALANQHRGALHGLGGFTSDLINEALHLCATLPAEDAWKRSPEAFAVVLERKVALVRAAARFAFRHHPTLAREALLTVDANQQALLAERMFTETSGQLPSEEATLC